MSKWSISKEQGVTLVELLAAMTLLIIVLVPFTDIFLNGFKASFQNEQHLDTKVIATEIIEELKMSVRENVKDVDIVGNNYDISDLSSVNVTEDHVTINETEFLLSFSIREYIIPDVLMNEVITVKPDNLYKISVSLKPLQEIVNGEEISLDVVVKQ